MRRVLTELFSALTMVLHPLNMPLYLANSVPQKAAFPYATADIALPAPAAPGRVTLTAWSLSPDAHLLTLSWADALPACLPPQGLKLCLPHGTAVLYPSQKEAPQRLVSGEALGLALPFDLQTYPAP